MTGLQSTYFKDLTNERYYLQHTAVYESALRNWYAKRPELLVDLCSLTIIKNNVRGDGYKPMPGEAILIAKGDKILGHLTRRFKELMPYHPELESHPLMTERKLCSLEREGEVRLVA